MNAPLKPTTEQLHTELYRTLCRVNGGNAIDDLDTELSKLVQEVDASGKPGSITLTLNLRKAAAGALAIKGTVKVKRPAVPEPETLMFPTEAGTLLTEDPRQLKLDVAEVVEAPARVLRTVGGNT